MPTETTRPPAPRQHGTVAAYTIGGCRCAPCAQAQRAYNTQRRRLIAYGRWRPYVDAEPVREHLRHLAEHGMSYRQAARLAGLSATRVGEILYGAPHRDRSPARRIRPETADALLAVTPQLESMAPSTLVDGTGARRRLQALVARGWPQKRLSERLEMDRTTINSVVASDQRVYAATALRVRRLYDELWDQEPPESTHTERVSASRARNYAAARDWAPPLAWDDDTIDDPTAQLDLGAEVPRTQALGEDAAELEQLGYPRAAIAQRLNITTSHLAQVLAQHRRQQQKTSAA